jgi:hypothetical protein
VKRRLAVLAERVCFLIGDAVAKLLDVWPWEFGSGAIYAVYRRFMGFSWLIDKKYELGEWKPASITEPQDATP